MRKEVWKPVVGYEGLYAVSNFGKVKSLGRYENGHIRHGEKNVVFYRKETILKQINNYDYKRVCLCKNGSKKMFSVHRIEMIAFVPNPNNYPFINHKDENKNNNFIWVNDDGTVDLEKSNLEWCTHEYNCNYGTAIKRTHEKQKNGKCSKSIIQYDLDGNFLKEYPSLNEIKRSLGYNPSAISRCCKGIYKQMNGYIWKYKSET